MLNPQHASSNHYGPNGHPSTAAIGADVAADGDWHLPPLIDPLSAAYLTPSDPAPTKFVNLLLTPLSQGASRLFNRKIDKARVDQRRLLQERPNQPIQIGIWRDIPDVLSVRPEEELDFLVHRSPLYVPRLTRGTVAQLSRWFTGQQRYVPASDETVVHMVLHTAVSHYLQHRDIRGVPCYFLDLTEQMEMAGGSERATFNVKNIAIGKEVRDGSRDIFIEMDDGEIYDRRHPKWTLVKFYFQVSWTHAAVGMVHTWVHFSFPNVTAALLENLCIDGRMQREGNLYKLLAPHTQFTIRISYQALHDSKFSAQTEPSLASKLTPWVSLPLDEDTFGKIIATRVNRHYIHGPDIGSVFPPRFDLTKPYDRFIQAYWERADAFVREIDPAIDEAEYIAFATELGQYLPDVKTAKRHDVLSSLIWQTGLLHSVDHYTVYQYGRYGVPMATERFDPNTKKTPDQLVSGWNLMKWRNASNIFVGNLADDTTLEMRTQNIDYHFSDPRLQAANAAFRESLHSLDEKFATEGRQICPLRYIVRSICY